MLLKYALNYTHNDTNKTNKQYCCQIKQTKKFKNSVFVRKKG